MSDKVQKIKNSENNKTYILLETVSTVHFCYSKQYIT